MVPAFPGSQRPLARTSRRFPATAGTARNGSPAGRLDHPGYAHRPSVSDNAFTNVMARWNLRAAAAAAERAGEAGSESRGWRQVAESIVGAATAPRPLPHHRPAAGAPPPPGHHAASPPNPARRRPPSRPPPGLLAARRCTRKRARRRGQVRCRPAHAGSCGNRVTCRDRIPRVPPAGSAVLRPGNHRRPAPVSVHVPSLRVHAQHPERGSQRLGSVSRCRAEVFLQTAQEPLVARPAAGGVLAGRRLRPWHASAAGTIFETRGYPCQRCPLTTPAFPRPTAPPGPMVTSGRLPAVTARRGGRPP